MGKGRISWPNKRPCQPLAPDVKQEDWDAIFGERQHKSKAFTRYIYKNGKFVEEETPKPPERWIPKEERDK